MAQRLARKLCDHCKVPESVPELELRELGFTPQQLAQGVTLFKPVGCPHCSAGYKGRVGIYEIMLMSEHIARLIMEGANSLQIAAVAQQEGMRSLRVSGLEKARQGITSLTEINRVTTN